MSDGGATEKNIYARRRNCGNPIAKKFAVAFGLPLEQIRRAGVGVEVALFFVEPRIHAHVEPGDMHLEPEAGKVADALFDLRD